MVRLIIRNFIAGAVTGLLNPFVVPMVSGYIPLPFLVTQSVIMGILVVIVALILQKIGL